jgi:hypothetical protein
MAVVDMNFNKKENYAGVGFEACGITWQDSLLGMLSKQEGFDAVIHYAGLIAKFTKSKTESAFDGISGMFRQVEEILAGPGAVRKAFDAGKNFKKLVYKTTRNTGNALKFGADLGQCAKKVSKFFKALTNAGVVQVSSANAYLVHYTGKGFGVFADVCSLTLAGIDLREDGLKSAEKYDKCAKIATAITSISFAVFTILTGVFSVSAPWLSVAIPLSLTLMITAFTISGLTSVNLKRVNSKDAMEKGNRLLKEGPETKQEITKEINKLQAKLDKAEVARIAEETRIAAEAAEAAEAADKGGDGGKK